MADESDLTTGDGASGDGAGGEERVYRDAVGERVTERLVEDEMRESFLDYSMSVIVQRALPDVRDGLSAPADPLRHERARPHPGPGVQEERHGGG